MSVAAVTGSTAVATETGPTTERDAVDAHQIDPLGGSELDVLQGADAVEQLVSSGDLDDVADRAGIATDELIDELVDDQSLFLTGDGQLGYAEALDLAASPAAGPLAALPLGVDAAALSSTPTSSRVIYLDFDGHTTADAAWVSAGAPAVIDSAPFDIDGVPGFSPDERAIMYEVWQRVSEDYLPFDVNVTTIDPGVDGLRKTSSTDAAYGQRMVISPTNFAGAGVLGLALLGTFDSSADRPAFVFTDSGASPTKAIAEAVSHEAGHTFGLLHDGRAGASYYDGHGIWAPIMGRSINPAMPVTQWSRGEYAGADNQQDDLGLIAARAGLRPDDHGATLCTASVVGSSSTTAGIIGTTGDRDIFLVDAGAGNLAVTLRPPSGTAAWSNLYASVTVRASTGVVVASGTAPSPTSWTSASTGVVAAGQYTIEVEPLGWLDASTGFTTYGSLGAYEVSVSAQPAPAGPQPQDCPSTFTPVTPTRLIDTRSNIGGSRVGAGRQVVVQVGGATAPADATAAVFSIVAANPTAPGYLTAYPCSNDRPETSTVNFIGGQTLANSTIAALSSAGQLCVWTSADTDIIVDITGWLGPSGSSRFNPIGPTRIVDTRAAIGGVRVGAGTTLSVDLGPSVPAGSTAVALNVTAVNSSAPGYLTVYPCGGPLPETSTVNHVAREARPNNTIVGLSAGRICIFSYAESDVLVDLVGSFGPTGLAYEPTPPVRVIDTRQYRAPIAAQETVGYSVVAPALGGEQPSAAFVNVTATNHAVPGYVTTFDCGVRRETSTLNQQVGQTAANGAIVPLAANLQSCAWMYGGGHLIVDLNGWWVP